MKYAEELDKVKKFVIANQLLKSATSIGAKRNIGFCFVIILNVTKILLIVL